MADVGDDLLDGELDETAFGDLDGEEEDALLADDDYESYQNTRQMATAKTAGQGDGRTGIFHHIVDQVQDVSEGDEIIEDAEDDILELAVVDELDESELDNGQGNNQGWEEAVSGTVIEAGSSNIHHPLSHGDDSGVGVSSSTNISTTRREGGGESDEEETDGRGSRFKSERTNIISLKGVTSTKSLSDIPDSLDNVKTATPGGRPQGEGRSSVRGRLGPIPPWRRGPTGPGPGRRPPPPPPGTKILVNPHFRGGMHHQPPGVWNNDRLPPPPGCEGFPPPMHGPPQEGGWGGPPHPHMMRPPFPPQQPGYPPHGHSGYPPQGPPGPGYPPQQHVQGYEEQYRPAMIDPTQRPTPTESMQAANRIVQFSEHSQLVTVENQHFQRTQFDQNFAPPNNQFHPPHNGPPQFNSPPYPNQFNDLSPRPHFQPQPHSIQNISPNYPQHYYPQQEFYPGPNASPYQNQNWDQSLQHMDHQQNQFYPQHQPQTNPNPSHDLMGGPQHVRPAFQSSSFQRPNFNTPQHKQFQGVIRHGMKRQPPKQMHTGVPPKQMRFDQNKPKTVPSTTRSNLQEIKTVDNLPDTTTKPELEPAPKVEPQPEIEEDEETKQYRLKIQEQTALREKIVKEKEARRLAAILEKKQQQESDPNFKGRKIKVPRILVGRVLGNDAVQKMFHPKTGEEKQVAHQLQIQLVQQQQQKPIRPQQQQQLARQQQQQGRPQQQQQLARQQQQQGRPQQFKQPWSRQHKPQVKQLQPSPQSVVPSDKPVVQIQQMLGTMYKIVKVRTKEGAIVTRKTPLVMESKEEMKPVTQRRIVLNPSSTAPANLGRGALSNIRMASRQNNGRTLFTVQTASVPRPQRVVIDNRVAITPNIPHSSLVTIENLSLSTKQAQLQKLAKECGTLSSIKHEPDLKKATLKFQKPSEAEKFYFKFHRKMIDLSRISVTVVPE